MGDIQQGRHELNLGPAMDGNLRGFVLSPAATEWLATNQMERERPDQAVYRLLLQQLCDPSMLIEHMYGGADPLSDPSAGQFAFGMFRHNEPHHIERTVFYTFTAAEPENMVTRGVRGESSYLAFYTPYHTRLISDEQLSRSRVLSADTIEKRITARAAGVLDNSGAHWSPVRLATHYQARRRPQSEHARAIEQSALEFFTNSLRDQYFISRTLVSAAFGATNTRGVAGLPGFSQQLIKLEHDRYSPMIRAGQEVSAERIIADLAEAGICRLENHELPNQAHTTFVTFNGKIVVFQGLPALSPKAASMRDENTSAYLTHMLRQPAPDSEQPDTIYANPQSAIPADIARLLLAHSLPPQYADEDSGITVYLHDFAKQEQREAALVQRVSEWLNGQLGYDIMQLHDWFLQTFGQQDPVYQRFFS